MIDEGENITPISAQGEMIATLRIAAKILYQNFMLIDRSLIVFHSNLAAPEKP